MSDWKPLHVYLREEYLAGQEGQDFDWIVRDQEHLSFRAKFIRWEGENVILQRFMHTEDGHVYVDIPPVDASTLRSVEHIDVKLRHLEGL